MPLALPLLAALSVPSALGEAPAPSATAEPATPGPRVLGLRSRDQLALVGLGAGAMAGAGFDRATPGTGTWLPVVLGLGGGLAPGLLPDEALTPGSGLRAATFAGAGAWSGDAAARLALGADARGARLRPAAAATGDLLGLGLSLGWRDPGRLGPRGWALASGGAATGAGAARGLAGLGLLPDERAAAGLELGLGWMGLVGMGLAARDGAAELSLTRATLYTAHGAWLGGWLPVLLDPQAPERTRQGGLLLGAGLGWTAAAFTPGPPTRAGEFSSAGMWGVTGAALGLGLPRLVVGEESPSAPLAGMLVGGLGGSAAGLALAHHYDDDPGDILVVLGGQAWAVASAGAWSTWAQTTEGVDPLGAGVTAWSLNGALALGVPTVLELSAPEAFGAGTLAAWGTWVAGVGGVALRLEPGPRTFATAATGELGLVVGGLAAAGPWDPTLAGLVRANGGGLLGAGLGAFGVAAVSDEPQHLAAGALGGSLLGLGAGLVLRPIDAGRPLPTLPVRVHPQLGPWLAEDGSTGLLLTLHVVDAPPEPSPETR